MRENLLPVASLALQTQFHIVSTMAFSWGLSRKFQ
ncbi:hypothetical protein VCSRO84_2831 [Vibrio cholerae]|nr:hypothetical protein VCSRO84_2831 [Vibrio cholerae]